MDLPGSFVSSIFSNLSGRSKEGIGVGDVALSTEITQDIVIE